MFAFAFFSAFVFPFALAFVFTLVLAYFTLSFIWTFGASGGEKNILKMNIDRTKMVSTRKAKAETTETPQRIGTLKTTMESKQYTTR